MRSVQVRRIRLLGFMNNPGKVSLELPPVGLVLVTGQNGAGKSRFVEAVSYAGWGKTLRGTDPRRAGEMGGVELLTGFGLEATRFWNDHHKNELAIWHRLADASLNTQYEFDTASKAQEHLTGVLGEWDTWRRSCAFSSSDDLSFATATDAERKRLLESLLGLQRFDAAQERCRRDTRQAAQAAQEAERALLRIQTAKTQAEANLEALAAVAAMAAPSADLAGLRMRLTALEEALPAAEKAVQREEATLRAAQQALANYEAQERRLAAQVRELAGSKSCPTCDQAWPDQVARDQKQAQLEGQLKAHQASRPVVGDQAALRQAQRAVQDGQRGIATLGQQLRTAEEAQQRYQEAQELVKNAKVALLDMEDQHDTAVAELEEHKATLRHLEITDSVLGTKGARAHMLHDALRGLEQVANLWLDRIARVDAPLRLKLSPYTEKKSGGTSDAISLEVEGAGGGKGYRAASGGEQRRIDVALMLALAQVAQMADGRVAPTMFFDEVFDALDGAGREAVVNVLDQLAHDRCVVVMTHSVELIDILVPDVRVTVVDGQVVIK